MALLFVCLAHFGSGYFNPNGMGGPTVVAWRVGMVASPLFIILSGIMLGVLYHTRQDCFGPIKAKFILRGLFLLTIGHVLLVGSQIAIVGSLETSLTWQFMTDVIGLNFVVGVLLIEHLPRRHLMVLGCGLYAVSWGSLIWWHPESLFFPYVKQLFVGAEQFQLDKAYVDFPYLPWLGVYLLASGLGSEIGQYARNGNHAKTARLIFQVALALLASAFLMKIGYRLLIKPSLLLHAQDPLWLYPLVDPFQKIPPAPVYLAFYGGIGLLLMSLLFWLEEHSRCETVLTVMRTLGRTSLFVFLLQAYVYFTVFPLLHLSPTPFWPVYFVSSLLVIFAASRLWLTWRKPLALLLPGSSRVLAPWRSTTVPGRHQAATAGLVAHPEGVTTRRLHCTVESLSLKEVAEPAARETGGALTQHPKSRPAAA